MWTCKHCNNEFDFKTINEKANHSRWCKKNPKRYNTDNLKLAQQKRADDILGILKEFTVVCDICGTFFTVTEREKQHPIKEKYYCSTGCAHSVGGTAKWKNYKNQHYTTICWKYHERKCIVCGEDKIVAVHHYDENHDNNSPDNFIPLCPTHHTYMHSKYKYLIIDIVEEYHNNFGLVA